MSEQIRPFDPDEDDVTQRWSRWIERFKLFLLVKKITDDTEQMNNLLYYGGEYLHLKYLPVKDGPDKFPDVIQKLTDIFNPPATAQVNIFKFNNGKQEEGELFDDFMSRLRMMADFCKFTDKEVQIKNRIIQACLSDQLRSCAL
jgi:hypothetical protein